jgi:chemotaxis-related protein WspB
MPGWEKGSGMLHLRFRIGAESYALPAFRIAEVLPLVEVRPLPRAAPGVAGIMDYHGRLLPVIDLSELLIGRPATRRLSTRIVVVHYGDGVESAELLGLIVERATRAEPHDAADFAHTGVASPQAPYLGGVTVHAAGMVQLIDVNRLLPASLRALLFRQAAQV